MRYALISGPRARGLDVLSALEADMVSSTDEDQLAFSTASERSIFTYNVGDFCLPHTRHFYSGNQHAGITVCNRLTLGVGE